MTEPKWESDGFALALVFRADDFFDIKARGSVREMADCFGMNGRRFKAICPPNRYVVCLVPEMQYTYGCEHFADVIGPYCPECGAEVVAWQ